jgi:hypothetical protein
LQDSASASNHVRVIAICLKLIQTQSEGKSSLGGKDYLKMLMSILPYASWPYQGDDDTSSHQSTNQKPVEGHDGLNLLRL